MIVSATLHRVIAPPLERARPGHRGTLDRPALPGAGPHPAGVISTTPPGGAPPGRGTPLSQDPHRARRGRAYRRPVKASGNRRTRERFPYQGFYSAHSGRAGRYEHEYPEAIL